MTSEKITIGVPIPYNTHNSTIWDMDKGNSGIASLRAATIVISTPYMDEAERCSRVALMSEGKVIVCDQPRHIREMVQGDLVEIRLDDWRKGAKLIRPIPGVLEVQTYGESLRIFVDRAEDRIPVIRFVLQEHRVKYRSLRRTSTSMEEAFVSLVRRLES